MTTLAPSAQPSAFAVFRKRSFSFLWIGQLISTSGADIGDVSTYDGDSSPWFFMRVESNDVPDATYRCVLDMDDGSTVAIGRLWAVKGHGGWGEHLNVDPRHAVAARLLDPKGATVGTARLR